MTCIRLLITLQGTYFYGDDLKVVISVQSYCAIGSEINEDRFISKYSGGP